MNRIRFAESLFAFCCTIFLSNFQCAFGAEQQTLPDPSPQHLPRWRGFNLQEKFDRGDSGPFHEEDFQLIQQLGFNFVRLPMDYRTWIVNDNWTEFREDTLKEIDQAIEWGKKYEIHVCLCFHRAPGYTVAKPPEARSLWTDSEAQRVCALHWAMFAQRYKGTSNRNLSFNLFNEPGNISPYVYADVVQKIVQAIRAEDPERLIICDGTNIGTTPVPELQKFAVAEATRGYMPKELTHYQAPWIKGSNGFPEPTWPRLITFGTFMTAAARQRLTFNGPFTQPTKIRLHVGIVSEKATLVVSADNQQIWSKAFVCGPGTGEWEKSQYFLRWGIYQNYYARDYECLIPAGTDAIQLSIKDGDWLQLKEIGFTQPNSNEVIVPYLPAWGTGPVQVAFQAQGTDADVKSLAASAGERAEDWIWQSSIAPWKRLEAQGIGVMVGEFGCLNHTPHSVMLSWLHDVLQDWKKADWGWALWEFRGPFGVLDSKRQDVQYENFHGHKLDRQMLELLQSY